MKAVKPMNRQAARLSATPFSVNQLVPIPELPLQQQICDLLSRIEVVAAVAERDLMALSKRAPALLQSALHNVFGGEARRLDEEDSETTEEIDVETPD